MSTRSVSSRTSLRINRSGSTSLLRMLYLTGLSAIRGNINRIVLSV